MTAQPSAQLFVFPLTRRVKFIAKTARYMSEQVREDTAEKQLRHALSVQADTMQKRGIQTETIDRQIKSAENAIRLEYWRLLGSEAGGAA